MAVAICLTAFLFQSCGSNCRTHDQLICAEGVTFWIDSCGNQEEIAEMCECGCNMDYTNCEQDCQKQCETNEDCPQGYWCDRTVWECKEISCIPNCTGKCCGSDGCDGTCPDNCPVGYTCNMITCACEADVGPCAGVDCDGHGTCVEWQGQALCSCEDGYNTSADGLHCEFAGYMISLTWSFSDAASCTAAQVAEVDVMLLQGGTELASAAITCSQGGGADIEEVQDGSYAIELRAKSNSGELTYYGDGNVTVSGQDAAIHITMEPIGFLVFTWDMAGQTCNSAGVSNVGVIVKNEAGTSTLYTASPVPSCTEGGHSTEQTAFFYLGNYNLVLEGICTSDQSTGYSLDATMMITQKGENNYGLLSLDAVGGGCP